MNSTRIIMRGLTLTAMAAALAACSFVPAYQRPAAPVPTQWVSADTEALTGSAAATLDWQDFIQDERLRHLVLLALDNNRDLRQTLLNVEAARAHYRIQRADRLPGVDAQASGARQRVPGDLNATGAPQVLEEWQAGIGVTAFELDLFGRVRSLSESALQEYLATEEAAHGVRISLVAEVIQAYLVQDGAQRRSMLTRQTLEARERSLELVAQRQGAGAASALDYQEAVGLAEQARAELERIDREFRQASNALGLLVGVADIDSHLAGLSGQGEDRVLLQEIPAGTPSELLTQRPDIRAAEHRLLARNADIGAARAAFFPRLSLTGFFGSASPELSDLFDSGQRTWSFSPQVVVPIFSGGRNRANLDLAMLRKDIAVAEYEGTIQVAFREVSDALAAIDTLRREEAARSALARSSAEALKLSEARYRAGVDDHLRYLDAQRADFANQSALIEVATQRQVALADLFKTLGGGWPSASPEDTSGSTNTD